MEMRGVADVGSLPTEDVGAETAARYRYQAALAARVILHSVQDDSDVLQVICEWWGDYVVARRDQPRELVSVKHLEPGQRPWTLKDLFDKGGLRQLFDRWRETEERCLVRLQTNSGLRPGDNEPGGLREAVVYGDQDLLRVWAERLVPYLMPDADPASPETVDRLVRFLRVLTLEDRQPNREYIEATLQAHAAATTCASLGLPAEAASLVVEEAITLALEAGAVTREDVVARLLTNDSSLVTDPLAMTLLEAKTIDDKLLRRRINRRVMDGPDGPRILDEANVPERLVQKLDRGGFKPNAVEHARQLRLNWLERMRRLSGGTRQPSDTQARLEFAALDLVRKAEHGIDTSDVPYGTALRVRVEAEAHAYLGEANIPFLNHDDILGAVYTLTERCKLWWSEPFEIELPS
jgi:hypothetical protein